MLRKLLATTAVATIISTGAFAQTAPAPVDPATPVETPAQEVQPANGFLASNIIGESVYNSTAEDAVNIGKVNDIVVGQSGGVEQLVVGVGGFLGVGEKNVAVDFKQASWAEKNGDRWIVVETSKDALQALPDFDRKVYDVEAPDTASAAPAENTAMAPAAPAASDAAATDKTTTAAIDKSTLQPFDTAKATSQDLVGTTVYGAEDANLGEISNVVMSGDKVDSVVIDVGGFLGMGEKPVAVGMDNLAFLTDKDGKKYLYTTFTKDQLEAQPAYDEASWTEKRGEQRMMLQ